MYAFYDLETTDTDADFGQILQIGVIITDDDFNIVSTHSLRARRQPWVIPSPGALLVNNVTPEQLENGDSLFDVMLQFDKILKDAGVDVKRGGYNIMKFDEAGITSAAHQNLLDDVSPDVPRIDVIKMVQACLIHRPGVLKLDEKSVKGHVRTALGIVARQNGVPLSEEEAHEAVGDVRATIGLAKLIREGAPEIWDQVMALSTPQGVDNFTAAHDMFCLSEMFFGKTRSRILAPLAENAAFNLASDPRPFLTKTPEELADMMTDENWDENPFVALERTAGPILMPEAPPSQVKTDPAILIARAALIKNDLAFRENVAKAIALIREHTPVPHDIERQTYEAIPDDVKPLLDRWKKEFREADWPGRAALIRDFDTRFAEAEKTTPELHRFVQFARRIVFDNAPEQMTQAEQASYKAAIWKRIMNLGPPEGMMTIPGARAEIELLHKELSEGTSKVLKPGDEHKLDALRAYYDMLEAKYAPAAPQPPAPGPAP